MATATKESRAGSGIAEAWRDSLKVADGSKDGKERKGK
jgi:hypothetical protein